MQLTPENLRKYLASKGLIAKAVSYEKPAATLRMRVAVTSADLTADIDKGDLKDSGIDPEKLILSGKHQAPQL